MLRSDESRLCWKSKVIRLSEKTTHTELGLACPTKLIMLLQQNAVFPPTVSRDLACPTKVFDAQQRNRLSRGRPSKVSKGSFERRLSAPDGRPSPQIVYAASSVIISGGKWWCSGERLGLTRQSSRDRNFFQKKRTRVGRQTSS